MSQSLSLLLVHVIFSTKERMPLLKGDIRPNLHAYMAATVRNLDCECFLVGGVEDHVHLAVGLSRTLTVAKCVEHLKTSSSRWLKAQSNALREFSWQNGYAAFSVSPQGLAGLKRYIAQQDSHHKRSNFQDEMCVLLTKYGVAFDERYLWD